MYFKSNFKWLIYKLIFLINYSFLTKVSKYTLIIINYKNKNFKNSKIRMSEFFTFNLLGTMNKIGEANLIVDQYPYSL